VTRVSVFFGRLTEQGQREIRIHILEPESRTAMRTVRMTIWKYYKSRLGVGQMPATRKKNGGRGGEQNQNEVLLEDSDE
jgi:hypothetical protein